MTIIKKLILAPLFLICSALLNYQLVAIIKSTDILFNLELQTFIQLVVITLVVLATSLFFIVFATLSANWAFVIPIIFVSASFPLIFFKTPLNFFMAAGFSLAYIIGYIILDNKLRSYLDFHPTSLLGPTVSSLTGWLIVVIAISYFLSLNIEFKQTSFKIPDSLIDSALRFTPMPEQINQESNTNQLPEITLEQIQFLRQNPQALQQAGIDLKMLDTVEQALLNNKANEKPNVNNLAISSKDLIKQTIKDQLDTMVKPYLSYIPALLAVLLFITLKSISSLLAILITPIIWLMFLIFQKTGFVSFTTETRAVKKLVV